jgi:predicted nucleotidyltransferase
MTPIVKMKFGSHVYGCDTPTSDTDYKGVFIPHIADLLLGRQPKTSITRSTKQDSTNGKRNSSEDVDEEMFTLQGWLRMVAEGQVVALDMLFTPDEFLIEGDMKKWNEIRHFAKTHLLSKNTTAYIGYCRKQASKYGIKGSRVADVRALLELLSSFPKLNRLYEHYETLEAFCADKEFTSIVENEKEMRNIGGGGVKNKWVHLLLECCNRKSALTTRVGEAVDMYTKLLNDYGQRALAAETNEGVDWKAMHHAMRCCYEAIELLDTHNITFPLPNKEYLLSIKKGQLEYKVVAAQLEEMMAEVERAAKRTTLPDEPNWEEMDNFVYKEYLIGALHA